MNVGRHWGPSLIITIMCCHCRSGRLEARLIVCLVFATAVNHIRPERAEALGPSAVGDKQQASHWSQLCRPDRITDKHVKVSASGRKGERGKKGQTISVKYRTDQYGVTFVSKLSKQKKKKIERKEK